MKARIQHIGEWIQRHKIATLLVMAFILAAALGIKQIYWEYKVATRKPSKRTVISPAPQCGVSGLACHKRLWGVSGHAPLPNRQMPSFQQRHLGAGVAHIASS